MDNKGFPIYQYSVFLKNGRDEQLVIRADTFEELMEAKKNIDLILKKVEQPTATPTDGLHCMTCGEPAVERKGVSKKSGKPYDGIFCSSETASHTTWL